MRNKEKLYSITLTSTILVFLFLTSVSTAASAVQEIQLTQNGSLASTPAIYGDNVVWSDYINDSGIIHLYNLTTSKDIQLDSFHGSWPAIYGDKIVWRDYQICGNNEDYNLSVYDISTAEKFQITKNVSEYIIPAIYEDKIVWHNSQNGVSDIYMYNLSTSTECQVTFNRNARYPAIYADRIVWTEYHNGNSNIYMYNLSTLKETQITNSELRQLDPDIYGDNIVWAGDRGGQRQSLNSDIYMYNISTSKITQITNSESASRPKIYKNNIIWMDSRNRNGYSDIYMYNISMEEETQINTNGSTQNWPAIYEDRLVWNDWRNGNGYSDIYTCIVPTIVKSPVANFSVTPDVGFAPLSVQFTDFSRNFILRSWDFNNDGIPESTEKSPVYTYTDPGNYTVNLTVSDANTTNSKLSTILVFPEHLVDNQLVLTEIQISTGGEAPYGSSPAIYGDKVVWQDSRNHFGNQGTDDVYMYDISTKKETRITTPTDGLGGRPDIYGDRIVWFDWRNGRHIYVHNISTYNRSKISVNESASTPLIYGDKVVWQDWRNGDWNIYMYDISTSKETRITTNESVPGGFDIYGDKIIWQDFRNGKNYESSDIYMYNFSTSKEDQITIGRSVYDPKIYGDRIIWQDYRDESRPIHVYNISNSTEIQISFPIRGGSTSEPDIYEDRIVYADWRNGNSDIFMYNLSTQKEIQITTNKSRQSYPAIYGNRIVWRNYGKYDTDIYMCTISLKQPGIPVANFSANVTSGCAPLSVQFTDLSENATEWKWDFGDNAYSAERNPVHTYNKAGGYTVSLIVKNENGMDMKERSKYISVSSSNDKRN